MDRRPVIGLVGQICAGKSAASEAFRRRGAKVYQADRAVHELYERDDVKQDVRRQFGEAVFDADGNVDRGRLGAAVFTDAGKLRTLTGEIIFPRTRETTKAMVATFRSSADCPALILDAPTLLEAGSGDQCDRLLFVSAPRERRRKWAREQRGWAPDELTKRERHLWTDERKRSRCDAIIENNGELAELDRRVGELWRCWIEQADTQASHDHAPRKDK